MTRLSNLPYHRFFVGLGTFLIGVGAIVALYQTKDVLSEIFKIRDAISDLKNGTEQIKEAVNSLKSERKASTAREYAPLFERRSSVPKHKSNQDLSQEQEKDLRLLLPDEKSDLKPGDIYLPSEAFPKLEGKLRSQDWGNAGNAENFLRENLQIWPYKEKKQIVR